MQGKGEDARSNACKFSFIFDLWGLERSLHPSSSFLSYAKEGNSLLIEKISPSKESSKRGKECAREEIIAGHKRSPRGIPSFDPARTIPDPWTTGAGTDATHLRRVLRNLCGRLAVGQHSQRIKIPCRTCGLSPNCRAFPIPAANRARPSRSVFRSSVSSFLPLSLPRKKKKSNLEINKR